jgi:hypothetical protein
MCMSILASVTTRLTIYSRQGNSVQNRNTMYVPAEASPIAPTSRRSASTGALSDSQHSTARPPLRQPLWGSGGSLPGPPPGPPPNSSRAASVSRVSDDQQGYLPVMSADANDSNVPIIAIPTTRRPPHRGTQLGPVPPTPADWTEFPRSPGLPLMRTPNRTIESISPHPLSIRTGVEQTGPQRSEIGSITSSSSHQSSSLREGSVKPIRERRSESRAARDRTNEGHSAVEPSSSYNSFIQSPDVLSAKPADLVLSSPGSTSIGRQNAVKKNRASPTDAKPASRRGSSMKSPMHIENTSTPPFSPESERKTSSSKPPTVPPKALPTPPPQAMFTHEYSSPSASLGVRSPDERPISHILHTPDNEDMDTKSPPLIPYKAVPSPLVTNPQCNQADAFAQNAMDRCIMFIAQESQAQSDTERLKLFAEFMVSESRIRRDRYSSAFVSMEASDVMDLTRDLWRSQQQSPTANQSSPAAARPSIGSPPPGPSRTDSMDSFASMSSPMSSNRNNFTPRSEPDSPASVASSSGARDTGPWARHQPVLSPIPSMAMSTVANPQDEVESRGRTPSRWWESSTGSVGHANRMERSKRESKYMGVPREAMASLQWLDEPSPSLHSNSTPRTVSQQAGEYPPEKVGWHEDMGAGPAFTPTYSRPSVPSTPDPHQLDVSRLVTLPPPYPRHYPANDNNHPDLETLRTTLEALRDLHDIAEPKEAFHAKVSQRRESQAQEAAERHAQMRHNIQEQLQLGQMSYASAAAAEEEFNVAEANSAQQVVQQEFTAFQPEVMTPLHALLSERITKATACITQLRAGLVTSADNPSPNQPQEEGDEQPELLEKLNLLKWLFEARETLHRQLFELEGEKNERYREMILMPFRNGGHEDQMRDAESFFASDRQERKITAEKSTHKRYEQFANVIEEVVSRGVEDQLNAFWDIAPGLLAVVQKVPTDLRDCELHIPAKEYEENPDYEHFPLLYLHSLLTHAEKSAYQFIESQINLMCLLHQAHTSVMDAGIRLLETQRCNEGEKWQDVAKEMEDCKRAEEQRLTAELKDKVGTVENQWTEALGSGLAEAKERVEHFLAKMDGWNPEFLE